MSGLSLKLNPTKTAAAKPKPKPGAFNAFGGGGDSDGETSEPDSGVFGSKSKSKSNSKDSKDVSKKSKNEDRNRVNAQLATFNAISKKAAEVQVEDESVYDYDAAYDQMKAAQRARKAKAQEEAATGKPKYMENLLAAAELRKKDHLRAKEKMLVKEREREGDEFKDKEAFVTEAYKKQQEELKRLEEEEKKKEEEDAKKSQGMTSFYRNVLERTEREYAEVTTAIATGAAADVPVEDEAPQEEFIPKGKDAEDTARIVKEKFGGSVEINDEGEIVDKRQLLKGGLNVLRKPSAAKPASSAGGPGATDANRPLHRAVGTNASKEEMRARHTRMLAEQLAARQKREREEEERERIELEVKAKSRKTEGEVLGAKERYLQRKREREEAKKREAGGG